jgi:hypothetical protein
MKRIPLTQGKFALVDDQDYDFLMQWKWYACYIHKTHYAKRSVRIGLKTIRIRMHREILKRMRLHIAGKKIDHRDRNGLNNRRSNLRIATNSQNQHNQGIRKNNKSGYKGVTWNKQHNKWQARICINWKEIWLGLFDDKKDAAKAYNEAALKYHGKFAVLNKV